MIDIEAIRRWPDYTEADAARFAHINWPHVCELARSMVKIRSVVQPIQIATDLDEDVKTGLSLLIFLNIEASPGEIFDGGHRLLAMRNQGVRYTIGVWPAEADPVW